VPAELRLAVSKRRVPSMVAFILDASADGTISADEGRHVQRAARRDCGGVLAVCAVRTGGVVLR